jgi:hypothetical protein
MTLENLDLIAGWAGLVLTLMVFSYLLADNFLYRIAVHVLVGAAAAYIAIAAVEEILIPWLDTTIFSDDAEASAGIRALGVLPLFFGLLLLLKSSPRFARLGNLGTVFMIAVGTGVALVGAVLGTVLPLAQDASNSFDNETTLNGAILLIGTLCTLVYFQYLSRRRADGEVASRPHMRALRFVGQGFVTLTLGALYASAIVTSLSIFSAVVGEQLRFILDQLGG